MSNLYYAQIYSAVVSALIVTSCGRGNAVKGKLDTNPSSSFLQRISIFLLTSNFVFLMKRNVEL